MKIQIIGRVITIWDKVFYKLRVYFDVLVTRNKVFSESSNYIDTHLDVVVEFLRSRTVFPLSSVLMRSS